MNRVRSLGWPLMTFGTAMLVLSASEYFFLYPRVFFKPQEAVYRAYHFLLMHIGGMIVAATMGPFSSFPASGRDTRKYIALWASSTSWAASSAASAACNVAPPAVGCWSGSAFFLLGVVLVISVSEAYIEIRGRHVQDHREWMTRSFAMIFAAVTLRM